jgi:hypothetical protein
MEYGLLLFPYHDCMPAGFALPRAQWAAEGKTGLLAGKRIRLCKMREGILRPQASGS